MQNDKEHEIIRYLKWIYEARDFAKEEACAALDWSEPDWQMHHGEMFRRKPGSDEVYSMRYQAVINYLEYVELQEARRASKHAFRTAIAAIVISGILASGGIGLGIHQLATPSEIIMDQGQLDEIKMLIDQRGEQ